MKSLIKKYLKHFGYEIKKIPVPYNTFSIKNNSLIEPNFDKVHYACGTNLLKDWMNIDILPVQERFVKKINLTQKHPFNNKSFQFAYAEEFIEHINQKEVLLFFSEVFRTLKKDGIFRLSFCNLENILKEGYLVNNFEEIQNSNHFFFDLSNRLNIYTAAQIEILLRYVGFKEINNEKYCESKFEELSKLETRMDQVGINSYIEATK